MCPPTIVSDARPDPMEPLTRERRRAMTRRYLLDAAAIVFGRKGFQTATLDEVASTAGFSKGAVYSNFNSKDDLFLALIDDRMHRLFDATSQLIGASDVSAVGVRDLVHSGALAPDEAWETLYLEFVLYARRDDAAAQKLAELARQEHKLIQALIERECAVANVEPATPVDELATIVQSLFSGLGTARLVDATAISPLTIDIVLALVHQSMGLAAEPRSDAGGSGDGPGSSERSSE